MAFYAQTARSIQASGWTFSQATAFLEINHVADGVIWQGISVRFVGQAALGGVDLRLVRLSAAVQMQKLDCPEGCYCHSAALCFSTLPDYFPGHAGL
ncbi:MAG: hypothetical protein LBP52_06625 [Burkholderiaceae bacterium]|nr:hypothetical protein [Burkholderiaceae bacterium]